MQRVTATVRGYSTPCSSHWVRALLLFFAGIALAWAGTTYTDFLAALGKRESSLNPAADNAKTHYIGLFQMGEAALQDVGVYKGDGTKTNDWLGGWTGKYGASSKAAFLADPNAQIQAETAYLNRVWNSYLAPYGAGNYLGKTINGILITQSGLVAASHLVGAGKVKTWLSSNGATAPVDGSGTRMTEYLQKFGGYALSATAPTYAALLAATPTGGASTIVTPSTPYATTAPLVTAPPLLPGISAAAPSYANAAEGFHGATGYQMGDVRAVFVLLTAALVLLWFARTFVSTWAGFTDGKLTLPHIGNNAVQGAIVVLILMYLLV